MSEIIHTNENCLTSSQTGATPLFIASQNGNLELAEILLKAGAGVDLARNVSYFNQILTSYSLPLLFHSHFKTIRTSVNVGS